MLQFWQKGRIFLIIRQTLAVLAILFGVCLGQNAQAASIYDMRIGQGVGSIRIAFDCQKGFDYKVFLLNEPKRLVIDIGDATADSKIEKIKDSNNLVSKTRIGNDGSRIVFDLKKPVTVKNAFMLKPQSNLPWRFVVDVQIASEREFLSKLGSSHAISKDNVKEIKAVKSNGASRTVANKNMPKKKIIVLDPGHGGKDPGAIGYSGMYEKNITLSMAKELKEILDNKGKYTVYLTRDRDKTLALRERVRLARAYNADLFVSIHADSAYNRRAKGLSVYTLSENASDKEAAALADRENKADIVAGLDFTEHSKEVADILINLAQRETMNRSSEFASFMVTEMRKGVQLVADTHRFAGFVVLKAPDVPSVLLEMGYLSNRTEERLLKQRDYRKKLAVSAAKAIDKFFQNSQQASLF